MRTIAAVTVARSDYGILLPVLRRIQGDPDLQLRLLAAGMHLSRKFGLTVKTIEEDGFEIGDRIDMIPASDTPEDIGKAMGRGVIGFSRSYADFRPDILLVLGDRFEMLTSVIASLPFAIPVAHIHGGESTEALIDEAIRHSITKMSHLHFASTEYYARRIVQMGEEPWRVVVSGAPALDNIANMPLLSPAELREAYDVDLASPTLLVTFHPVTLEYEQTDYQVRELLAALSETEHHMVFTCPNADTYSSLVMNLIQHFVASNSHRAKLIINLGTQGYFSFMAHVDAMVGNSSSGIIEAPSYKLPVVNIGNRQQGRLRCSNVIDVGCHRAEILSGVSKATSPEFLGSLADLISPYGDGHASAIIVDTLKTIDLSERLVIKQFYSPSEE